MITDTRKALDAIAERVGLESIRTKAFRHTYCATRLQTVDRGAPVSEYTVAKEMSHGGTSLVRPVYGHLGQVRHRSEFVEYRVEQHREEVKDGLTLMRGRSRPRRRGNPRRPRGVRKTVSGTVPTVPT